MSKKIALLFLLLLTFGCEEYAQQKRVCSFSDEVYTEVVVIKGQEVTLYKRDRVCCNTTTNQCVNEKIYSPGY